MRWTRRVLSVVGVLALCAGALGVGIMLRAALPGLGTASASADKPLPQARAERMDVEGAVYGRVVIGDRVIMDLVDTQYDLEPYERAIIAARRINLALRRDVAPHEFQAGEYNDQWVVLAAGRPIITVAPRDAEVQRISPKALAQRWATAITVALYEAMTPAPAAEEPAPAEEPADGPLPPLPVAARKFDVDGAEAAALMFGDTEVLRISAGAPGLSPAGRVETLATRLRDAVAEGATPHDIRAADLFDMAIVQVSETLLVTVTEADAAQAGTTPGALAVDWATALADAVATHYADAGKTTVAEPGAAWQPAEPYDDKWVPIVSVLSGTRIGMARVNGPRSRVRTVQAVAQIELKWRNYVEIDVMLPISTSTPGRTLDRVEGCGITGLGDLRL